MNLPFNIMIGLLAAPVGVLLAPHVARFFARRAYRFLVVLVFAAAFLLFALVVAYRQMEQGLEPSKTGLYLLLLLFVLYCVAALWYAQLIRRGTWQRVWIQALKHLGRRL